MKSICFLAFFASSFFSWSQYIYGSISSGYQLNSKIDQAQKLYKRSYALGGFGCSVGLRVVLWAK